MEIINISIIVIAVLILGAVITICFNRSDKNVDKISFKEALDLTDLPIITFMQGNNKYNFLLDTGSTDSHINRKVVESKCLNYKESNHVRNVFGMNGEPVIVNIINTVFYLNSNKFESDFLVNDLGTAFDSIKRESGVTLHGILGSRFFEKYKYVIDFSKNIAYSKR